MKKSVLISIILITNLYTAVSLFATSTEKLFTYDEQAISAEFQELTQLEHYVLENEGITITEMIEKNHPLVFHNSLNLNSTCSSTFSDDVPAFCCGCCLGPVGVALVYLATDGDVSEVSESIIGCMVPVAISVVAAIFEEAWLWVEWY